MVLKRGALIAAALCLCGCLPRVEVRRLDKPAAVAVAFVRDPEHGGAVAAVPEALSKRVGESLAARNLEVREVPFGSVAADFGAAPDSGLRYKKVAAEARGAPLLLLVETRAAFFSQLSGRYRWTVYAKVTAGLAGAEPVSAELTVPALLDFNHEREPEALAVAAPFIADRAGAIFDSFLAASKLGTGTPKPQAPEPAIPAQPSP